MGLKGAIAMYDEKAKIRNDRYKKAKREKVQLDVPKGTLAKYKAFAERKGMSMTAFITSLMEEEMSKDAEFCAEWAEREKAEAEKAEQEMADTVAAIKAGMKPPAAK